MPKKLIYSERAERPCGRYFVLHDIPTHNLKRIEVDTKGQLRYQFHKKRS